MKLLELVLNKRKIITIALFISFTIFVIWFALLKREPEHQRIFKPELFWAIRAWLAGEYNGRAETIQYFENILFFISFGLLFPWKEKWPLVFICALTLSIVIEVVQFIFSLGWCEIDDVITNTAGAMIGYWGYVIIRKNCMRYRGEKRNNHVD